MSKPPLIIVGVGRSGTTWVQRAFTQVGAFSTTRSAHERLGVRAGSVAARCGVLTGPAEGYRLWRSRAPSLLTPVPRAEDWRLPPNEAVAFSAAVTALGSRRRPVLKCTAFNRSVPALLDALGECRLLCVWRDPSSVVRSLCSVAFWPSLRLWTQEGRMPLEFDRQQHAELARDLWAAEAVALNSALRAGAPGVVQHVVYEELWSDRTLLAKACRALGLDDAELAALDLPAPTNTAGSGRTGWWSSVPELGDRAPADLLRHLGDAR